MRTLDHASASTATPSSSFSPPERVLASMQRSRWRGLTDLDAWAGENIDKVIVLPRAINAAKKSNFQDHLFAYAALDMLASTYRDVKLGLADRMDYKRDCDRLGLSMGGCSEATRCADYYFTWYDKRLVLDQHIGRGKSRDPRYCFRAYFTWEPDESKVIIGWAPGHLPTKNC